MVDLPAVLDYQVCHDFLVVADPVLLAAIALINLGLRKSHRLGLQKSKTFSVQLVAGWLPILLTKSKSERLNYCTKYVIFQGLQSRKSSIRDRTCFSMASHCYELGMAQGPTVFWHPCELISLYPAAQIFNYLRFTFYGEQQNKYVKSNKDSLVSFLVCSVCYPFMSLNLQHVRPNRGARQIKINPGFITEDSFDTSWSLEKASTRFGSAGRCRLKGERCYNMD